MAGPGDMMLVTQVAVFHNKRAFDQLVKKYQSPVRRFFLNLTLGDTQLSDDLAQDTFVKAYLKINTFRGVSGFGTWLFRIAYNVFYDYRRSHKPTVDDNAPELSLRSAGGSDGTIRMDIYEAMKILKEEERTCITLQVLEGFTVDKIVAATGMAEGTVKSHLSRGKKQLANYLRKNGYE